MPQRRLYDEPTTTFTFRISVESRELLDWLAATKGTTGSHYMREVWEEHLRANGFELTRGVDAVRDPEWGTREGWVRDHTTRRERV